MGDRRAADPGVEGAVAGRGYRMRLMRRRSPERRSTLLRLGRPEAEQGGVLGHFTSIYGHASTSPRSASWWLRPRRTGPRTWWCCGDAMALSCAAMRYPEGARERPVPRPGRCRPNRGGPTPSRRTPGSGRAAVAVHCTASYHRDVEEIAFLVRTLMPAQLRPRKLPAPALVAAVPRLARAPDYGPAASSSISRAA